MKKNIIMAIAFMACSISVSKCVPIDASKDTKDAAKDTKGKDNKDNNGAMLKGSIAAIIDAQLALLKPKKEFLSKEVAVLDQQITKLKAEKDKLSKKK